MEVWRGVALGLGCNIKSAFCKEKRKKSEIREMQNKREEKVDGKNDCQM